MGELISYGKIPEITFEGLFTREEVFRMIDAYFSELGFSREEKKIEGIHQQGRLVYAWKGAYTKKVTDYVKVTITVEVKLEVTGKRRITINGREREVEEGKVTIKAKGEGESDYEKQWEGSGLKWFFRLLTEKYWLNRELNDVKQDVKSILEGFARHVQDYFAIHRYKA